MSGYERDTMVWLFKRLLSLLGRHNPYWFSQPDVMLAPLLGFGAPQSEAQVGIETPSSFRAIFEAEISLQILSHHIWVWDQSFLHLCSSYQSGCGLFYTTLLIRLLFH